MNDMLALDMLDDYYNILNVSNDVETCSEAISECSEVCNNISKTIRFLKSGPTFKSLESFNELVGLSEITSVSLESVSIEHYISTSIESLSDRLKTIKEKIKQFIAWIIEKVTAFFNWIKGLISKNKTIIESSDKEVGEFLNIVQEVENIEKKPESSPKLLEAAREVLTEKEYNVIDPVQVKQVLGSLMSYKTQIGNFVKLCMDRINQASMVTQKHFFILRKLEENFPDREMGHVAYNEELNRFRKKVDEAVEYVKDVINMEEIMRQYDNISEAVANIEHVSTTQQKFWNEQLRKSAIESYKVCKGLIIEIQKHIDDVMKEHDVCKANVKKLYSNIENAKEYLSVDFIYHAFYNRVGDLWLSVRLWNDIMARIVDIQNKLRTSVLTMSGAARQVKS